MRIRKATMHLSNELNLPSPFVDAAKSNHRYKPNRYSVTEVLGGTCEAVLKRRHGHEVTEDVADRVWAIFGTAVHKVLEEAKHGPSQKAEKWLCVDIGEYELSGILDLYDADTKTVTDWKTTSVWSVMFKDYESWRTQTLVYCWMLRQNGEDARKGEIVALMRDHSMRKAQFEPDYPKHPVVKFEWEFSDEDFEGVAEKVGHWFAQVSRQEKRPDEELKPCSEPERWHKPDKWAVMRRGKKKAVKLFEDKESAVEHMDWLANQPSNKGKGLYVEHREGEDTRCESYCAVSAFCPHGKKFQKLSN